MKLFWILFTGLLVACVASVKPSLSGITEGVDLPQQIEIEAQGGVPLYDDAKLADVIKLMNRVLRQSRDFAPQDGEPHLFTPDPEHKLFPGRRFRLVLTDRPQITLLGRKIEIPTDMSAATVVALHDGVTEIALVARLDQLVFDGKGGYLPDAYFRTLSALLTQIHGSAREHMLHTPQEQRHFAEYRNQLDARVFQRVIEYFAALMGDDRVLKSESAGAYLGEIFRVWTSEQNQRSALLPGVSPEPFKLPTEIHWSPATLGALSAQNRAAAVALVYRALQLVYAVRPNDLTDTAFDVSLEKKESLTGKTVEMTFMDSRDNAARKRLGGVELAVDRDPWVSSETAISTDGRKTQFQIIFWTNRIFYNDQGTDPSALARATLALASEIYGGMQRHLFSTYDQMAAKQTDLDIAQYHVEVLERGTMFVDSLQTHALWNTLGAEEKAGFQTVRAEYANQVGFLRCGLALLRKAPKK